MVRFRAHVCAAIASVVVCGCAGATADTKPNLVNDIPPPSETGVVTGALPRSGYQLTEEEQKFDCSKLTGTMQIRILQVRGYDPDKKHLDWRAQPASTDDADLWRHQGRRRPRRAVPQRHRQAATPTIGSWPS